MRHLRQFVLLSLLLVAFVPTAKSIRSAPLAAPGDSAFGVGSNFASRYGGLASLDGAVNALADSGAGWAREDFQWQTIQPTPDQYSWEVADRVVDLLRAKGINILGVLSGPTPTWAAANGASGTFAAPDPQRFAAFAREVAAHFKGRVRYWQIWNEPENALYWQPMPDPAAYANLLKVVSPAIKEANPETQVLLGGIVPTHLDYLRGIFLNDGWNAFDILGLHPYVDPKSPEQGQIGAGDVSAVKALVGDLGPKPIWATEFGWATGPVARDPAGVDEQTQANYLVRSMALLRAVGVDKTIWYSFKDDPSGPYGLVRVGSGPADYSQRKPAFDALHSLNQWVGTLGSAILQPLGDARVIFDFEQFGVWSLSSNQSADPGQFTQSGDQKHSGNSSARMAFSFLDPTNNFYVARPRSAIAIPDGTSQLGIWVYAEHYAHALKVWLTDANNETLQFRLGFPGRGGWQFLSTPITGQVDDYNAVENKQNQRLDFPIKLTAIVLDDHTDTTPANGGVIYLDDITAFVGPEAYDVHFPIGDGNVVDVLWALQGVRVVIPTASGPVRQIPLDLGPSPTFLKYTPAVPVSPGPPPDIPIGCVGPGQCPGAPPLPPSSPNSDILRCIAVCSQIGIAALKLTLKAVCPGVCDATIELLSVANLSAALSKCNDNLCIATEFSKYGIGVLVKSVPIVNIIPTIATLAENVFALATDPSLCVQAKDFVKALMSESILSKIPLNSIITESPVYPLVINGSGQRAGFLPDGQVVTEIPDSRAVTAGEKRLVIYSGRDPVTVQVVGYAAGTMNLYTTFAQGEDTGVSLSYKDVSVTPGMKATLNSADNNHTLAIDTNGDGQVDQSRQPDSVETISPATGAPAASDGSFADTAFSTVWERTDKPLASGARGLQPRSWIWGPQPLTAGTRETYAEGSGGTRLVQYFDKSRMEINDPNAPRNQWYVTNGLLVVEMLEGRVQVGNSAFQDRAPADEAVAGDPGEGNPNAPTYRSFRSVAYPVNPQRAPKRSGEVVADVLARDGSVSQNPDLARYNIILDAYDEQLGHNIPKVFTTYFAQQGLVSEGGRYVRRPVFDWLFVMGLPISEPYWARVKVGGVEKDVLMQAFQRRVLTYTPGNSPGFEVEMGNVGQHYLRWRYGR